MGKYSSSVFCIRQAPQRSVASLILQMNETYISRSHARHVQLGVLQEPPELHGADQRSKEISIWWRDTLDDKKSFEVLMFFYKCVTLSCCTRFRCECDSGTQRRVGSNVSSSQPLTSFYQSIISAESIGFLVTLHKKVTKASFLALLLLENFNGAQSARIRFRTSTFICPSVVTEVSL